MKCSNCSAEYDGIKCPECGEFAIPVVINSKTAYERKNKKMEIFFIVAAVIVVIAIVVAVAVAKGKKFEENKIEWGMDLQSEHERYLTEEVVKGPLFLINYPKEIKSFYMRENDDGKTVAACDLLVPGVGELVGGSQREERYDVLKRKMEESHLPLDKYGWYLDLRRYGGCKHAGFGIGFERLVMYLSGINNIRDVLPYPRTPRNLKF